MPETSQTPLVEVTFTTTRPDTSVAFWGESTDPAVVAIRNTVASLAQDRNIPSEFQVVNSLTAKQTYRFFTTAAWREEFWPALQTAVPNLTTARSQYYTNANHSLSFKMMNTETGFVISELTLI